MKDSIFPVETSAATLEAILAEVLHPQLFRRWLAQQDPQNGSTLWLRNYVRAHLPGHSICLCRCFNTERDQPRHVESRMPRTRAPLQEWASIVADREYHAGNYRSLPDMFLLLDEVAPRTMYTHRPDGRLELERIPLYTDGNNRESGGFVQDISTSSP